MSGASRTLDAVELRAKVLIVSDSTWRGERDDLAGPLLTSRLTAAGFLVDDYRVVPDGVDAVSEALYELVEDFAGLVVTSGGTGFSPRDVTPEATLLVVEREAPGLSEAHAPRHSARAAVACPRGHAGSRARR